MAPQLACGHVLDHALTQRADGAIGTHGELLLSEVLRPRSFLRTGLPAPTMVSSRLATNPRSGTPRSSYRGSDLVHWPRAADFSIGPRRQLSEVHPPSYRRSRDGSPNPNFGSLSRRSVAHRPLSEVYRSPTNLAHGGLFRSR